MTEKLLHKFIENRLDTKEREQVVSWIESHPDHQKKYNLVKARYVSEGLQKLNTEHHHPMISYRKKKRQQRIAYVSIAASIVLVFGVSFFYFYGSETSTVEPNEAISNSIHLISDTEEIKTKKELPREIILPDGSLVSLGAESKISYPKSFSDSVRQVVLEGEAFFDIVHNEEKPFIVKTDDLNIRVLGTTFNVKSYPNDKLAETTLLSGKVELSLEEETPIVLAPSQKAIFNRDDKKIEIEKVVAENALDWKTGKLIFDNTPLQQVAIDLERKYDKKIAIASPELLNYKYTGAFDDLTLDEVLRLLAISSPVTYEIINQKIIISMK